MATESELLYTPVQAAQLLNVSRSRLYELMAAGKIRSVKIGHLRRIARQELVDFIGRLDAEPAGSPRAS